MAHTHHCQVCNAPVASCSDEKCLGDEGHFCSVHHPSEEHRRVDKPFPRMTVRLAGDET